jgi:hypothetical protein
MINISSAMGGQFAFTAAEITAEIERLGPNPLRSNGTGEKIQTKPDEAVQTEKVENGSND